MVLAFDIGNSTAVVGLFRNTTLIKTLRLQNTVSFSQQQLAKTLVGFLQSAHVQPDEIKGAVISSVVPLKTALFKKVIRQTVHIIAIVISGSTNVGIKIRYRPPSSLGADRLCHAVAAFEKYGGPCIVVDFGTATTFDVVSGKGEYLGGAIMSGVDTTARGLAERTAKLPLIPYRFPNKAIGRSTVTSMQSGILFGTIDAVEGMITRIRREVGKKSVVIATGGFSKLIAGKTRMIDTVDQWLVLEGAYRIYRRRSLKKR